MSAKQAQMKSWSSDMMDPPSMTDQQWYSVSLLGLVFLAMAISQVASFTDFKTALASFGLSGETTWATGLIIAELLAAVGFFKLRLSSLARMLSGLLALLVSGFWFIENLRLVSAGAAGVLHNSGYFGRFLTQSPGWWTVIEATVLLFWVIYALELVGVTVAMPMMGMMDKRR